MTLDNLAAIHADLGDIEKAWELSGNALQILRQAGDRFYEKDVLVNLAQLARRARGRPEEASGLLEEAEAISRSLDNVPALLKCLCEKGHVALARGGSAARWVAWLGGVGGGAVGADRSDAHGNSPV